MNSLEYLKEEMRTKLDHIVSIKQLQHVYKKHVNISTEDLRNRILYENKRYASTFIGQEKDILSMIKKLILEDPYIAEDLRGMVLSDDPDPIFLQGELSHNVKGIWYGSNRKERQWIYGPVECSEFIICFGKQENGGKGFQRVPLDLTQYSGSCFAIAAISFSFPTIYSIVLAFLLTANKTSSIS